MVAFGLLWAAESGAAGQSVLSAARPDPTRLQAPARLVLRPAAELQALAAAVLGVLELRSGEGVELGDAPPPGLPEAVPAGHVALLPRGARLQLVIGLAGGGSLEAFVSAGAGGALPDPRALALAVESLQDAAIEHARAAQLAARQRASEPSPVVGAQQPPQGALADAGADGSQPVPPEPLRLETPGQLRDDGPGAQGEAARGGDGIQPLVHARSYLGVTPATTGAVLALATGVGLCAIGYCLVIQGEFPVNGANTSPHDIRYRYMTFGSGIHAQPLRFGRLLPAANLLLITRLGHFDRDMGMATSGGTALSTDLGARASLELGVELFRRFDALVESGVDFTIDGWQLSAAGRTLERGERVVPWLQAGVRYRPY